MDTFECPALEDDDPCFSRDTFALSASGELIPMASLRSGDLVLDGPSSTTRKPNKAHAYTPLVV